MATNALKTASVLAFERKLDPSDAVFHAGRWDDRANSHAWQPVVVREKSVRGTISNRLKAKATIRDKAGKGKIILEYNSPQEFDALVKKLSES